MSRSSRQEKAATLQEMSDWNRKAHLYTRNSARVIGINCTAASYDFRFRFVPED